MRLLRTKNPKTLSSFVTVFVLSALFLSATNVRAELKTITFYEKDASEIVVQLEDNSKRIEIINDLKEQNSELEKKISNLLQVQKIQEEQLAVAKETLKSLQDLVSTQKDSYEQVLKEARPSFFDKLGLAVGGAGVGALLALVLLI
jgi:TolA-binding protein